jgi:phosphate-selective porin OprO/OprP
LSNIFRGQIRGDDVGSTHTHSIAAGLDALGGTSGTATDKVATGISDATAEMDSKAFGLEGIVALNSFKLQGEYTRGDYRANYQDTTSSMKLDNKAYYGEVLWLLTGEKYSGAYKKGTFSSIKPLKEFDLDNWSGLGAWELGLRYEAYDVTDGNMTGSGSGTRFQGSMNCSGTSSSALAGNSTQNASGCKSGAHTYTAGIKWILNPNVMVKAAYSRTSYDDAWTHFDIGSSGVNGKMMKHEDILSLRGQFTF